MVEELLAENTNLKSDLVPEPPVNPGSTAVIQLFEQAIGQFERFRELMGERMFPMTLAGLEAGTRELSR